MAWVCDSTNLQWKKCHQHVLFWNSENLKCKIKFYECHSAFVFEGWNVKCWYLCSFCEISSKEVARMFSVKRVETCYILMCQLCDMAVTVRDVTTFVAHPFFKVFITEVELKQVPHSYCPLKSLAGEEGKCMCVTVQCG